MSGGGNDDAGPEARHRQCMMVPVLAVVGYF
jgi:hypothetical protein